MKKQKNKGITLIALVVTIIVLLILAGISIMMLTGQNGILNRAGQAKEDTGNAQIDEMVKMSVMEALTNGNGRITEALLREALDKNLGAGNYTLTGNETDGWTIVANGKTYKVDANGTITSSTNNDSTGGNTGDVPAAGTPVKNPASYGENPNAQATADGAGKTFPKPDGGRYVEGTVDTGVVIDINGSEFVWVPVDDVVLDKNRASELPKSSDFTHKGEMSNEESGKYDASSGSGYLEFKQDCSKMYTPMVVKIDDTNYKEIPYYYYKDYVWIKYPDEENYYTTNGFYEPGDSTGKESGNNQSGNGSSESGSNGSSGNSGSVSNEIDQQAEYNKMVESVIKYGGFYVARYEACLDSNSNIAFKDASNSNNKVDTVNTDEKDGVAIESPERNAMDFDALSEKISQFETSSVTASIPWGCQYNAMLNWLRKTGSDITSDTARWDNKTDSIKNKKKITGYTKTDKFNNIYDLYGCHNEWVLERYRGSITLRGNFGLNGETTDTYKDINKSSRATLYIK